MHIVRGHECARGMQHLSLPVSSAPNFIYHSESAKIFIMHRHADSSGALNRCATRRAALALRRGDRFASLSLRACLTAGAPTCGAV